jgi:hypothetical protein
MSGEFVILKRVNAIPGIVVVVSILFDDLVDRETEVPAEIAKEKTLGTGDSEEGCSRQSTISKYWRNFI